MTAPDRIIVALTVFAALVGYVQGFSSVRPRWSASEAGCSSAGGWARPRSRAACSRPTRRCSGWWARLSAGSCWAGCSRRWVTGCAGGWTCWRSASPTGWGGAALATAVALGLAWLAGAVALQTPACASPLRSEVQRSAGAALAQRAAAAVRADPQRAGALRPRAEHRRASATVPAPRAAIARDPQVTAARAGRRARARDGVRLSKSPGPAGPLGTGWS